MDKVFHTPRVLKNMDLVQLKELRAELKTITGLSNFAKSCYESVAEGMVRIKPDGNNTDYYQWGFQQGALKAHEMYKDLLRLVIYEIENRDIDVAKKS